MVNKVFLVGNIGAIKSVQTKNGNTMCLLSLATNEKRKDRNGVVQKTTDWHSITTYSKTAEFCQKYLKKGSKVFIEGKIQYSKGQNRAGIEQTYTNIIANSVQSLSHSTGNDEANANDQAGQEGTETRDNSSAPTETQQALNISDDFGDVPDFFDNP